MQVRSLSGNSLETVWAHNLKVEVLKSKRANRAIAGNIFVYRERCPSRPTTELRAVLFSLLALPFSFAH